MHAFSVCCIHSQFLWASMPFVNSHNAAQIAIDGMRSVSKYQAPLKNCDGDNVHPDQCIMHLARGITINEHKKSVGQAWPRSSIRVVHDREYLGNVWYSAEMDAEVIAVIYDDEGVLLVECNGWYAADLE